MNAPHKVIEITPAATPFPTDRWYVAGFSWELKDKPLARTLLSRAMVLFRQPDGSIAALEDRCCHRELPLSCGTVEERGLRCGYHGLLFDSAGACVEIPGQDTIPIGRTSGIGDSRAFVCRRIWTGAHHALRRGRRSAV